MTAAKWLLGALLMVFAGLILFDLLVFSRLESRFKSLEHDRIVTSNKLATAKIIADNLNHVKDLIYQNMDFKGNKDSLGPDLAFYKNLTESVNDLKMTLVSIQPMAKQTKGRITTLAYEVVIEGDFFSFGEFCSKLENSRRIMALNGFELVTIGGENASIATGSSRRPLRINMQLQTFRVRK